MLPAQRPASPEIAESPIVTIQLGEADAGCWVGAAVAVGATKIGTANATTPTNAHIGRRTMTSPPPDRRVPTRPPMDAPSVAARRRPGKNPTANPRDR